MQKKQFASLSQRMVTPRVLARCFLTVVRCLQPYCQFSTSTSQWHIRNRFCRIKILCHIKAYVCSEYLYRWSRAEKCMIKKYLIVRLYENKISPQKVSWIDKVFWRQSKSRYHYITPVRVYIKPSNVSLPNTEAVFQHVSVSVVSQLTQKHIS